MPKRAYKRRFKKRTWRKGAKKMARAIVTGRGSAGKRSARSAHIRGFRNLLTRTRWTGSQIPQQLQKVFIWETTAQLASTEDTGIQYSVAQAFRLNSIWDPNWSTGPNQVAVQNFAMFLSNTGPYTNYRVMGCKISCRFMNLGATVAQIQPVLSNNQGMAVMSSGFTQNEVDAMSVLPTASEPIFVGALAGGNNITKRNFYITPWLALGTTRPVYITNGGYVGAYNSNPSAPLLMCFQVVGVNAPCVVHCRWKLKYYVQLINPYVIQNRNAVDVSAEPATGGLPPFVPEA